MKRVQIYLLTVIFLVVSGFQSSLLGQSTALQSQSTGATAVANSLLKVSLPAKENAVRFGIIGDTGTGTQKQYQLAGILQQYREAFPFDIVLMMGDKIYGGESPKDFKLKFEDVYRPLLDSK